MCNQLRLRVRTWIDSTLCRSHLMIDKKIYHYLSPVRFEQSTLIPLALTSILANPQSSPKMRCSVYKQLNHSVLQQGIKIQWTLNSYDMRSQDYVIFHSGNTQNNGIIPFV